MITAITIPTSSEPLQRTNNTSKYAQSTNQHCNSLSRHAYIATLKKLGWSKVAALTQDGQKYSDYMSLMQDEFQNNGIEFIMNRKFPKEATDMSMVILKFFIKDKKIHPTLFAT